MMSTVATSGAVLNTSFTKSLPNINFSIFKVQSWSGHSIPIPGGRRKREKRSKTQNNPTQISCQTSMQDYLTVPKTILKTEEHSHIYQKQLPQQKTEYSPENPAENHQNHRGKQETIHSPTNATNIHIQHCDHECVYEDFS